MNHAHQPWHQSVRKYPKSSFQNPLPLAQQGWQEHCAVLVLLQVVVRATPHYLLMVLNDDNDLLHTLTAVQITQESKGICQILFIIIDFIIFFSSSIVCAVRLALGGRQSSSVFIQLLVNRLRPLLI